MEFDDTRTFQSFQDCYFPLGSLPFHWICQLIFLVNFDRIFKLVSFVETKTDSCIGTLSKSSPDMVSF